MSPLRSVLLLTAALAAGCATSDGAQRDSVERGPTDTSQPTANTAPAEPMKAAAAKADPSQPAPTEPVPARPFAATKPMEVVKLPVANKPIVSLRLLFRAGSVDDPRGKEGLTQLTGTVLEEGGTQALTTAELIRALYPMAAELSISTDKEFTVVQGRVHKDHLDRFLQIFTDVLLHPRFDPGEFQRLRADQLNEVKNRLRNEDDETLGKVALDALMYEGHPYAHYVGGTVAALESITLDDVKQHWQRVFTQDRLLIGLAGAVDDALEQRVVQALSALPKTGAPAVQLPPAPGVHGRTLIVKKPAISTAISMGAAYPVRRGDPDFFPLFFAMSYLGEHRQSNGVLFQQLRGLRGLNYGDYAYAENFVQEGWSTLPSTNVARSTQHFSIWIRPVEPEAAMFATRGALHFFDQLIQQGIPEDRFEISRKFLDGFSRLWAVTDQRRLGYALDSRVYGTPDFLESYREALKTLTPAQVREALQRHYAPHKLNYAFVTKDAEGLEALLTAQPPTPLQYKSPKPPDVLKVDEVIAARRIPLDPAAIQVVDAQDFMAK